MTTQRRPFSRGGGNVAAGQRTSALRRQCPQCKRKGALLTKDLPPGVITGCRWCGWARLVDYFPDEDKTDDAIPKGRTS